MNNVKKIGTTKVVKIEILRKIVEGRWDREL